MAECSGLAGVRSSRVLVDFFSVFWLEETDTAQVSGCVGELQAGSEQEDFFFPTLFPTELKRRGCPAPGRKGACREGQRPDTRQGTPALAPGTRPQSSFKSLSDTMKNKAF